MSSSGCFRASERDGRDASAPFDVGVGDAGRDATRDAPVPDAGIDAPSSIVPPLDPDELPPLPPPEPPPSPDERPSDEADWDDDETPPTFEPCCEDDPIHTLNDATNVDGPPVVAWDGERWLVAWAEGAYPFWRVAMRFLDADARPVGPVRYLPDYSGRPRALAYDNGRFALFCDGYYAGRLLKVLTILDSQARVRANHLVDVEGGEALDVVRYPAVGGWAIVHNLYAERAYVDAIGDDMVRRARYELPDVEFARLVAFKARLAVVHADTDRGVTLEPFYGLLEHEPLWRLPAAPGAGGRPSTAFTAARLRDEVIVSVYAHTDEGEVRTYAYDPFAGERREQTRWSLLSGRSFGVGGTVGDDTLGVLAHCVGNQPTSGVALELALTTPAHGGLARGVAWSGGTHSNPGGCAVGTSDVSGTYALLWWDAVFSEGTNFVRGKRMRFVVEAAD